MKRTLTALALIALAALALAWVFREPLRDGLENLLTRDMFVAADGDAFDPGPAIGSHFPGLQATHAGRRVTLLEEFAGANGTVLVALRSVDWCPYCRRQLLQLQAYSAEFAAAGIALVAITYDPPEQQRRFTAQYGIDIPLLSDERALSFRTLGILNESYAPGDAAFGVPHPGLIVVDREGSVAGKLFLEDYTRRVDAAAVLAYARAVLGVAAP